MPRVRSIATIALLLGLTGPVVLEASGRFETCSMCAERCCCKPLEGSAMSRACRLSRPCAAGEQKATPPGVVFDPAVLDAAGPSIDAPLPAGLVPAATRAALSDRVGSPPVPPPRG